MTPLRPEKQKKLNGNHFGDDENDSDGNNGNAKKKQKTGIIGDEDDDNEDIDDEEQLMYMQAVEDAKGELDQEQDGCESVCADENQMGVAAVSLQKRKASLASLGKSDQESNKKAARQRCASGCAANPSFNGQLWQWWRGPVSQDSQDSQVCLWAVSGWRRSLTLGCFSFIVICQTNWWKRRWWQRYV